MRTMAVGAALALALAMVAGDAAAQQKQATVRDKASCERAVRDAREGVKEASLSEKTRGEADGLVTVAEHLCGQANFVYAEKVLAVARGMAAEE